MRSENSDENEKLRTERQGNSMRQEERQWISDRLRRLPGKISMIAWQPDTGEKTEFQPDLPHVAASVIKIPVMVEAFHRAGTGSLDFGAEVVIRPEEKMPSCGALTYLHDGLKVTVRDLVTLMIILSDNTATNLLIDILTEEAVNGEMTALGLSGRTRLRRKLFDAERARQGIENTVTAGDMASLLKRMLEGRLLSANASAEMLGILGDQQLNGKMPFYLHSHGIACAHKTGEDDGITHDVGIIYTDSPWIFCFLSSETEVPAAERAIQEIAAMLAGVSAE